MRLVELITIKSKASLSFKFCLAESWSIPQAASSLAAGFDTSHSFGPHPPTPPDQPNCEDGPAVPILQTFLTMAQHLMQRLGRAGSRFPLHPRFGTPGRFEARFMRFETLAICRAPPVVAGPLVTPWNSQKSFSSNSGGASPNDSCAEPSPQRSAANPTSNINLTWVVGPRFPHP